MNDPAGDVLARLVDAFNARDARGFVAQFTPNGDWVDFAGHWLAGESAILAAHASAFAGPLAHGELSVSDVISETLADGVALCHARWLITEQQTASGQSLGDRRGVFTLVAVRTPAGWRLRAGQNTEYHAAHFGRAGTDSAN